MQHPVAREARGMHLFRQLVGAIREHYRCIESATGAAAAEVRLLAAIAESPGGGVDDLAAQLSLHKSTVSNLARQLVVKGLAVRARDPLDRRGTRFRVSAKGSALLRDAPRPATGLLQELLGGLSAPELRRVESALELLTSRLPPEFSGHGGVSLASLARGRKRTVRNAD